MKALEDTSKDVIIAFLRNPNGNEQTDLSPKQQQLLNYYTDAYTLIRNYNSVPDTINVLVNLSIKRGEQISASTARRYIQDAQDVYGYVYKAKAEAIQHLAIEIIKDAIGMARDQNDPKTMIFGAKELMATGGKEIEQPFNPEMLEPHIIEILLDPDALKMLKLLTTKGPIDLDNIIGNVMQLQADDAITADDASTDN